MVGLVRRPDDERTADGQQQSLLLHHVLLLLSVDDELLLHLLQRIRPALVIAEVHLPRTSNAQS